MSIFGIVTAIFIIGIVGAVIAFLESRKKTRRTAATIASVRASADRPTTETVQNVIDEHEQHEALVCVDATRRLQLRTVSGADLSKVIAKYGSPGRLWNLDGKEVYALDLDTDGQHVPFETFMNADLLNSPRKAFIATQQQAVARYFESKDDRNILQKYGAILLFAGAVIFVMFMTVVS